MRQKIFILDIILNIDGKVNTNTVGLGFNPNRLNNNTFESSVLQTRTIGNHEMILNSLWKLKSCL